MRRCQGKITAASNGIAAQKLVVAIRVDNEVCIAVNIPRVLQYVAPSATRQCDVGNHQFELRAGTQELARSPPVGSLSEFDTALPKIRSRR